MAAMELTAELGGEMPQPHSATPDSNDGAPPLRIVIGENNTDLATTLSMLLETEPDMACVATVSSTRGVLDATERHQPNAFILDLSLDDGPSIGLIEQLRARLPRSAIVVFTGHKNELLNEQCRRAGADAVIVKSGEIAELTEALRRAANGAGGLKRAAST
jgi:DNA-binding NarL/FixJ family response regulator